MPGAPAKAGVVLRRRPALGSAVESREPVRVFYDMRRPLRIPHKGNGARTLMAPDGGLHGKFLGLRRRMDKN